MSQNLLKLSLAVAALSALAIVATIARPGFGSPNLARPDFDRVFSDAVSVSVPSFTEEDREALRQSGLKRIKRSAAERKIREA